MPPPPLSPLLLDDCCSSDLSLEESLLVLFCCWVLPEFVTVCPLCKEEEEELFFWPLLPPIIELAGLLRDDALAEDIFFVISLLACFSSC